MPVSRIREGAAKCIGSVGCEKPEQRVCSNAIETKPEILYPVS